MNRPTLFFVFTVSAVHLGCGDAATQEPELGSASSESALGQEFHLGKPFEVVNGVISRASNEYGLQASFYATRDPDETDIDVTVTTGKICLKGAITPAVVGDFDSYWGISFGFLASRDIEMRAPARITAEPVRDNSLVAWDFGGGRVLGIAATFRGPALPDPGLPGFGFGVAVGGSWALDGVGQALNLYADCNAPLVTTSGQVTESLFSELENGWCNPDAKAKWSANSVDSFGYGIGSTLVDDAAAAASVGPAAYDFCLGDIRPILAGAPPEER